MTSGWAAPRWVTWLLLILAAASSAISPAFFNVFNPTIHGVSMVPWILAALAFASNYSHSLSLFGLRLHPAFGGLGAALAAGAAAVSSTSADGKPSPLAIGIGFLSAVLSMVSKSVSNVVPLAAPVSSTAVEVNSSTPTIPYTGAKATAPPTPTH